MQRWQAITALTEAIRLDPSDLWALKERASALRTKGAYVEAIEDLGRVIQLHPKDAGAWNDRCYTRAVAGKLEEALADCNESLRLQPNLSNALVNRGLTYLKMDQPARAFADSATDAPKAPESTPGFGTRAHSEASLRPKWFLASAMLISRSPSPLAEGIE